MVMQVLFCSAVASLSELHYGYFLYLTKQIKHTFIYAVQLYLLITLTVIHLCPKLLSCSSRKSKEGLAALPWGPITSVVVPVNPTCLRHELLCRVRCYCAYTSLVRRKSTIHQSDTHLHSYLRQWVCVWDSVSVHSTYVCAAHFSLHSYDPFNWPTKSEHITFE